MPIKKAAMKALRQTQKRTARNKAVKETVEYLKRSLRKALAAKDIKKAGELVAQVIKAADKAVQNNVLKKNTGSRIKSRAMRALNAAKKK